MRLFKTENRGWGVKAASRIFKGSFVCEYMGEIINHEEAEKRGEEYGNIGRNYLFDLDFVEKSIDEDVFTVDAYKFGNMARFINHSCDPNCEIWPVLDDCLDIRFPRLCFFATRRIEEHEELTIDYSGGKVEKIENTPENQKRYEVCRCGAANCRQFIFN
jgi:histone-lysine N-methyltransferase SUV39H